MYPCTFRKLPMVFEHGDGYYYIVWETTCASGTPLLEWWIDLDNEYEGSRHVIEPWYKQIDSNHHRYTAILGPAESFPRIHYKIRNYKLSTKQYTINRLKNDGSVQILVIADNQNEPTTFRSVLSSSRKMYAKRQKYPNLILHVGDSIQSINKLSDWQTQLFAPMEDSGGFQHTTPLIFVPGNHDHDKRRGLDNRNYYMDMYHGIYSTDDLGSKPVANGSYHQFYHSISLGSARIIVLDAECPSKEQSEFLVSELQSSAFKNAHFRIVAIHIPPYIEFWDPYTWEHKGEKHWGEHVRLEYDNLFRQHGVDLVISGHQHNYQRSTIPRNRNSTAADTITYAIVGGAGGGLDLERVEDWNMYNVTYLDHHYVALDIDKSELRWTAYNVASSIVDHFSIVR
ncbi:hypothetical protein GGI25_004819 [Coemansia spiralis]|uniref:Calcineurin-like phosphoesterase domain-containing protein n=2 Tax=Coemansia TaxID=4863 RepID=A0A9W8FZR4_9FUNG|nr:hypothetical protein EDC05_004798 [Coemansia umbellata]KAJ2673225.1 hypothetical protein GGI25_004819 [Coemansia spiralis]